MAKHSSVLPCRSTEEFYIYFLHLKTPYPMKKILLFLFFFCLALIDVHAQFNIFDPRYSDDTVIPDSYWGHQDVLANHVDFVCLYEYNTIDSVLQEAHNHNLILQCTDSVATFFDYASYLMDSLVSVNNRKVTVGEYRPIFNQRTRENSGLCFALFFKRNFYRRNDAFMYNFFFYEEPLPKWDWKLYGETREVCGYLCHKASAKYAGRTWTAWYTEEIPSGAGPWLLYGLPGLILAATDNTGTHSFEAVSLHKPTLHQLLWSPRTKKLTRKYSLELEYNQAFHASKLLEASGIKSDTPIEDKRRFYNPLELE